MYTINENNYCSNDENLIIQQLISISFISELCKSDFLNSEFYKNMKFENDSIKDLIYTIKIDNQGMLLIFLYSLVLIPKEKIYKDYKEDYEIVNKYINKIKLSGYSTYTYNNTSDIQYIRHIRNAIGHGKVEFTEGKSVKFSDYDKNTGAKFSVEIALRDIGELLNKLQKILYKYIEDLKKHKQKV